MVLSGRGRRRAEQDWGKKRKEAVMAMALGMQELEAIVSAGRGVEAGWGGRC